MSFRNPNTEPRNVPEAAAASGPRRVASATRTRIAVSRLLQDGEHFGKYEIVRWIARGGMSEVYEAVHTGLRKPVALKVLRGELAENTEARERFALEGSNAALVRHPNVVDVSDVGWYQAFSYFKLAVICQGIAARAAGGSMLGSGFDTAQAMVDPLARAGLSLL